VAIFAVSYGGFDVYGEKLVGALNSGNRAEAWYEIRYNSNSDTQHAVRWFTVSQILRLYNDQANLTATQKDTEFKQIFAMYTRHVQDIGTYDFQYRNSVQGANANLTALNTTLAADLGVNPLANIGQVRALTTTAQGVTTQDLNGELQTAANFLKARYANGAPIGQIFVAPDTAITNQAAINLVDRSQDTTNDLIFGGQGNDTLSGGSGNDIVFGGTAINTINGNGGDDTLVGGLATNTLNGGAGNDTLFLNGTFYKYITNNGPSDWDGRTGNSGSTTMFGGDGNDKFYIGVSGSTNGSISIDGGAGQDVVSFQGSESVTVLVENGTATNAVGKQIILRNVETLVGTESNDTLTINVRENTKVKVIGGAGHDIVRINQGDLLISLGSDSAFNQSRKEDAVEVVGVETVYAPDTDSTIVGSGQAVVYLGNGNNTLISAGAGSVINASQGHNVFHLSNQVLLRRSGRPDPLSGTS
jgi:Ca2+-binding RTX toxin-like protein